MADRGSDPRGNAPSELIDVKKEYTARGIRLYLVLQILQFLCFSDT